MAPVMKYNPETGESLDKAKTPEEAAAEEAARLKALAEYKERVKARKPRKKKVVEEEEDLPEPVLIKSNGQPPIVIKPGKVVPVKVNPFEAPNGEIPAESLIEPLNAILKDIERALQLITKGYKLDNDGAMTNKVSIPEKFEYKPGVTRIKSNNQEAFNLNKPGIASLNYDNLYKDTYVDRVALRPLDVKELLKYPDKAYELLKDLIIDNMWKNLWETKQLDPKKKYFGNTIGTIKRPGMGETYCSVVSGDFDFIEIRLYSDATPLPEGVKDERVGKSVNNGARS